MKKYEYVSIEAYNPFGSVSEDYRQIIDKYAAKGYRYVGFIPTNFFDFGKFKNIDLVFEIEQ